MAVFTYSRVPAFNPNTTPVSVARSATGSVYDIGDTGFTTPLNLTLVATNTVTTTLVSDANGMFPDFTLVDRTQCVFKSGSNTFVLTTTTPIPGPAGAASTVPGPPGPATTDASLLTAGTVADARLPTRLSDTSLNATYLKRGHTDYLTPTAPMFELATSAGSGRIFHLLSGAGSTSEIAGVGVDNDNSTGFVFSLKAKNNIGIGVNLETTSGSDSIGILGTALSTGKIVELRKGSQNGGVLVSLRADYGGTGTLFQWGLPGTSVAATLTVSVSTVTATGHGMVAGQRLSFSAITGTTGISNGTTYYVAGTVTANTFQVAASLGGAPITFGGTNGTANYVAADNLNGYIDAVDGSLVLQSGNTNASKIRASVVSGGTQESHYVYSGTPGLWFPNAVASASNSFKFQQGNAAAIGSETMVTLIELKNANAIGLYGATPVTRAAAITSPTAPSATYVQAEAQAMKTAVDAIRTALTNIGITA